MPIASITSDVKGLSESYVSQNVKKYNKLISDINADVNGKVWIFWQRDEQEKFQVILGGIKEINDFYADITSEKKKAEVRKAMASSIEEIKKFTVDVAQQLAQEGNDKQALEKELQTLESSSGQTDPQTLETKRLSLKKRLELADRRLAMMKQFQSNYSRIEPALQEALGEIERFILVVEESAKFYKDAYRTLKLSHDINAAYKQLEDFQKLEPLSQDLENSWKELENFVLTLTGQIAHFKGE